MTKDQVYLRVCATLAEALNVDPDEVQLASKLQEDLGAEPIDLLDIVFRLERDFKIKIPRNVLFPENILQGDPVLVNVLTGIVTREGIEVLRASIPFADIRIFETYPHVDLIPDLFTVGMIVEYLTHRLGIDDDDFPQPDIIIQG